MSLSWIFLQPTSQPTRQPTTQPTSRPSCPSGAEISLYFPSLLFSSLYSYIPASFVLLTLSHLLFLSCFIYNSFLASYILSYFFFHFCLVYFSFPNPYILYLLWILQASHLGSPLQSHLVIHLIVPSVVHQVNLHHSLLVYPRDILLQWFNWSSSWAFFRWNYIFYAKIC